ncbi:MAG: hypothetical protein LBD11_00085 [Candidatus Peribacteria bacterium]|jgi:sugar-specific transcriptional regulator TrmB|nr:hypothetical protein [Candidatus Peribacteria bacterium]
MELLDLLIKNSFSEKEAKIYLACLQLKIANASTIARFSGEKRSTTYSILKELQKKGVINEIDKNKIASYSAVPPETIVKKLETQVADFKELLPAFSAFTEKFGIAPKVQFFEGSEGLLEIYNDTISSQVEICVLIGTASYPKYANEYLNSVFLPQKLKNQIFSRVILSDSEQNRTSFKKLAPKFKKLNRNWKIVNGLTFPENIMINMYGPNKVLIAVLTEKESFGLIISSYYLYETLLGVFNFLWK